MPLSQITLLENESGFIAGVTNPMFLQNKRCHDLSCRVDESKLNADASYERQPYYGIDKEFITALLQRVKDRTINDEEIRQAFFSYTQLILDLATNLKPDNSPDTIGLTHNGIPLTEIFANRTYKLQKTHLFRAHITTIKFMQFDFHHGVCLSTIKNHMRSLRIRGWPEHPLSDFEVHKIYKDIDTFVQDKASAKKVLYLLPECREGVGLLAHGLFYDDDAVQESTARILLKLKKANRAGDKAIGKLSEFFRMRLIDLIDELGLQ